ncbi:MAG: pyruvate kinase [Ignavibacteriaceae bacterium]
MSLLITEGFAKTKILATIGPATGTSEQIKKLIHAGIDGVRLNLSHGDYNFFTEVFKEINSACTDERTPVSILIDLQGPKIRIGLLTEPAIEITTGDKIEISIEDFVGTKDKVSTSYKYLADDAQVGDPILIDDGLIRLRIAEKTPKSVICFIENGGILRPKKGMNLPGMKLSTPSVTEKDLKDLEFALQHRIDYIALSFVRTSRDITSLREWLKNRNAVIPIIAKIEKKEAVDNFNEILEVSDGIMVARGDLGVELNPQDVPIIQKQIISKCNQYGKLVITATQMLESMITNPVPTRAEASDVANAVWDGTDVVMLSGETSIGRYPFKAVQLMNDIIKNAEQHIIEREIEYVIPSQVEENLFDSVGKAIVTISRQINAAAVVAVTYNGRTARLLAKFRPKAKIIAMSNSFETMNNLCLRWGVTSIYCEDLNKDHFAIDSAKRMIVEAGHVKEGDIVIFTAGAPYSEKSRANWLRFEVI